MNRRVRQWIGSLLLGMAVSMTPYCMISSFAASAKIAFSDPSTKVGDEVSVTMKFTSTSGEVLGNTDVMLAYDASLLEFIDEEDDNASGGSGAIRVWSGPGSTEVATTLKFKALQAGTANITVTSWEGYDNEGQSLTMEREGSSKITITGLETSSNDATLKSLQVSPGVLNPAFTPNTENYTTSVGLDVERLTVSALANNDNATVAVEGGDALAEGDNTVICKVTAQDGTTVKTYTITVSKVEGGDSLTTDSSGEGETTAPVELEVLAEIDVSAKKVQFLSMPENLEIPAGLVERSIAIGDTRLQGWTVGEKETSDYCIFYGRIGDGEPGFYRYDTVEKTVQKYFQDEAAGPLTPEQQKALEDYNDLLDDFKMRLYIIIGLGVLAGILAIALVVVLVTKGNKKDSFVYDDDDTEEPAEEKRVPAQVRGKKLSKEERYMMGVEDDYEEPELEDEALTMSDPEDYMPEPAEPVKAKAAVPMEDVEAVIAANLAKEAAAAARMPEPEEEFLDEEDDDFEFFDLDDK